MFTDYPDTPFLVPFDGSYRIAKAKTTPPKSSTPKRESKLLKEAQETLAELQSTLYASDRHSILLIFQAMDAAGKDSTIRAVLQGVNPAGCQVFSFKAPSAEDLDHDFLWRTTRCLPERGRIGIFNRSYYEEVLVVRVHPQILRNQRLPATIPMDTLWEDRFGSIRDHEKHLARNGTVILKFWLNVSRDEQRNRFVDRIDKRKKNWKFAPGDVKERSHWTEYMHAYEEALNATSRPHAPWFAIPADDKPFMRATVAQLVVDTMLRLGLTYPKVSEAEREKLLAFRDQLLDD